MFQINKIKNNAKAHSITKRVALGFRNVVNKKRYMTFQLYLRLSYAV